MRRARSLVEGPHTGHAALNPIFFKQPGPRAALPVRAPRGALLTQVALTLVASSLVGCASMQSGQAATSGVASLADGQHSATEDSGAPALIPDVDTPQRYTDAELVLERGFTALDAGDDATSLGYLRAALRSDFLTPRGRAQVYWTAAGAARRVGDRTGERSHLEGFLLVRETLPDGVLDSDVDLAVQASIARGVLLAHQIESRGLGRAPRRALVVEDKNDTRAAIAALGCGSDGASALTFVDEALVENEGSILLRRGVTCTSDGDRFNLWFDVSSAIERGNTRPQTARFAPRERK
jgi:hypothetical protein